jgi:lysophospholipase L1-like esterase
MKKRVLAILLIGVLLFTTACGGKGADELGVAGSGGISQGQNQSAPEQGGQGSAQQGEGNASQPGANPQQGGSTTQQGGGEQNGNASSGSASLGETFGAGKPVEMKKGETLWFGPVSADQAAQLTFTAGSTSSGGGAVKVADIGGGFSIYSFTAKADGKATPAVGDAYKDVFLASKTKMGLAEYFGYWDNKQNRNVYDIRFDKGKWLNASAKEQSGSGTSTHAIPVSKGETVTFGPVRAGTPVLGWGYDSNMKAIKMINGYGLKTAFTYTNGMVALTYTVPEGISFVRLNVGSEEASLFAIMKNNAFTKEMYERLTGKKITAADDPLYKKKILFVGDSICAAGADSGTLKGWARRVQEDAGAECYNVGVSGAALSTCRLGRPGATQNHQIANQLNVHKNVKFDYVLIHGGVNDAWDSKPIGTVSKGYDLAGFDTTTYAGGLELAIYTAIENYGDTAAIGYLMNFQLPQCKYGVVSTKLGDYFAVGRQICEKWGISYFDMFSNKEINNRLQVNSTKYLPDGVHPNEGGYDVLGPYITKYMRTMTPVIQDVLDELKSQ